MHIPYEFHWNDPEHSIIRVDIGGQVSWEEFNSLTDRVCDELAKATQNIDLIYNEKVGMSEAGLPLSNLLPHFKVTGTKLSAVNNIGLIVNVSAQRISSVVKALVEIITRAYGMNMKQSGGYIGSIDEALVVINKIRAKDQVAKAVS